MEIIVILILLIVGIACALYVGSPIKPPGRHAANPYEPDGHRETAHRVYPRVTKTPPAPPRKDPS